MSWPDEVMENYTHEQQRFRLVEIAFGKQLKSQLPNIPDFAAFGQQVVAAADNVLAAMETTPDTGPSAEAEKMPALMDVRAEVKDYLDSEIWRYESDPTTDPYVQAFRDGNTAGCGAALGFIDKAIGKAAMEEPGETEDDNAKG